MVPTEENILAFIQTIRDSFIGSVEIYTRGSCYQFYTILKQVVPWATPYYDSNHVITEINGKFYDITGEVKKERHLLMAEHYPEPGGVKDCRFNIYQNILECTECGEGIQLHAYIAEHHPGMKVPECLNCEALKRNNKILRKLLDKYRPDEGAAVLDGSINLAEKIIREEAEAPEMQLIDPPRCCGRCIPGIDNCIYDKDDE